MSKSKKITVRDLASMGYSSNNVCNNLLTIPCCGGTSANLLIVVSGHCIAFYGIEDGGSCVFLEPKLDIGGGLPAIKDFIERELGFTGVVPEDFGIDEQSIRLLEYNIKKDGLTGKAVTFKNNVYVKEAISGSSDIKITRCNLAAVVVVDLTKSLIAKFVDIVLGAVTNPSIATNAISRYEGKTYSHDTSGLRPYGLGKFTDTNGITYEGTFNGEIFDGEVGVTFPQLSKEKPPITVTLECNTNTTSDEVVVTAPKPKNPIPASVPVIGSATYEFVQDLTCKGSKFTGVVCDGEPFLGLANKGGVVTVGIFEDGTLKRGVNENTTTTTVTRVKPPSLSCCSAGAITLTPETTREKVSNR